MPPSFLELSLSPEDTSGLYRYHLIQGLEVITGEDLALHELGPPGAWFAGSP